MRRGTGRAPAATPPSCDSPLRPHTCARGRARRPWARASRRTRRPAADPGATAGPAGPRTATPAARGTARRPPPRRRRTTRRGGPPRRSGAAARRRRGRTSTPGCSGTRRRASHSPPARARRQPRRRPPPPRGTPTRERGPPAARRGMRRRRSPCPAASAPPRARSARSPPPPPPRRTGSGRATRRCRRCRRPPPKTRTPPASRPAGRRRATTTRRRRDGASAGDGSVHVFTTDLYWRGPLKRFKTFRSALSSLCAAGVSQQGQARLPETAPKHLRAKGNACACLCRTATFNPRHYGADEALGRPPDLTRPWAYGTYGTVSVGTAGICRCPMMLYMCQTWRSRRCEIQYLYGYIRHITAVYNIP